MRRLGARHAAPDFPATTWPRQAQGHVQRQPPARRPSALRWGTQAVLPHGACTAALRERDMRVRDRLAPPRPSQGTSLG